MPETDPDIEEEVRFGLKSHALKAIAEFERTMVVFAFNKTVAAVWEFINEMNKYIDVTAPWELAKQKSCRKQLQAVIYNLLDGLRIISGLIYPFMPDTACTMQKHLGRDPEEPFYLLDSLKSWNMTQRGTVLPKSIALFPRIDREKMAAESSTAKSGGQGGTAGSRLSPPLKPEIDIETLAKVDIRVGTVVKATVIPRAKKLLKLEVDIGETRTIVAGIAGSYAPEDMTGKPVIVVANLKPAKIMGVLSNGMLLAALEKHGCNVATVDKDVKPGTPLS